MIFNNELFIFFIIVILIILSYYDLKYIIIFLSILFLINIYFNKITYENEYKEYEQYDEEVNSVLNDFKKYKKIDEQNYKLGLKYYKYFINNIKTLHKLKDHVSFKSVLDNTSVYLDKSIEKFNSILFSINTYDREFEQNFINDLNRLKKESNNLLQNTKNHYDKIKYNENMNNYKYNMFIDNDPQIKLFSESYPEIYNPIYKGLNIFEDDEIDRNYDCQETKLLY